MRSTGLLVHNGLCLNIGGEGEVSGYTDVNNMSSSMVTPDAIAAANPTGNTVIADAGALPFADGSATDIVANNFPGSAIGQDAEGIASEIARVLSDGGTAAITSSSPVFANPGIAAAFEGAGFTILNGFTAIIP